MSGSAVSRGGSSAAAWHALAEQAPGLGTCLAGFHHRNYRLDAGADSDALRELDVRTPVKVRVGRRNALTVVERPWPDEGAVLRALADAAVIPNIPHFYAGRGDVSVHEFVPGRSLAEVCPPGKPVGTIHVEQVIEQMALFTRVPREALPPLPHNWAREGDSRGFLRDRVDFAEHVVRGANWADFAGLFAALEVPANALRQLRDRLPALRPRPFALIHGDLHRHNIIVRDDNQQLTLVDWELAMWGDPLHDLAIHLVRMRYPADQRWEVVQRWRDAVGPAYAAGLHQDLPVYINYERAQSLFADTLRVALDLADSAAGAGLGAGAGTGVGAAVSRVRNALHMAAGPLRLNRVPSRTEVERALLGWVRGRRSRPA